MKLGETIQKIIRPVRSHAPMHVVVDLTLMLPGGMNGGIKLAFIELFNRVRIDEGKRLRCTFLTNSWTHGDFPAIRRPGDVAICVRALEGKLPNPAHFQPEDYTVLEGRSAAITTLSANLYYNPLCEDLPRTGAVPVVVLHADTLHRDVEGALPRQEVDRRENFIRKNVKRAQRIQTISEFSRTQIEHHYLESAGKVFVTHLPIQNRFAKWGKSREPLIEGDYFLYPANFWAHKNHGFLLKVFRDYVTNSSNQAWKLVLTGNDETAAQHFMQQVENMGMSDRIKFLGHVAEGDFIALLENAGALVFPSTYEGFGIPPLEAMACGVPVICSDAGSLPEIVKDGAHIVATNHEEAWVNALIKISSDSAWRKELCRRGQRVQKSYSLEREARTLGENLRLAADFSLRGTEEKSKPASRSLR